MNHLDHTQDILRQLIAYPTISADSNLQMIEYLGIIWIMWVRMFC